MQRERPDDLQYQGTSPPELHRAIHYLGSKLRFASDIADVVERVSPAGGIACDLFSGSGVVAGAIGQRRPVVAVDIQEYARVVAAASLNPAEVDSRTMETLTSLDSLDSNEQSLREAWAPLVRLEQSAIATAREGDAEPLAQLLESLPLVAVQLDGADRLPSSLRAVFREVELALIASGLDDSADSVTSRYYGGLYFGFTQAVELDLLRRRMRSLEIGSNAMADTMMSALLSTASSIVGTIGQQFAQPLRPRSKDGRPKAGLWKRVDADRSIDVMKVFRQNLLLASARKPALSPSRAVRSDYRKFLESVDEPISAVYADPPYTRDHYSRYYHVLETIALGDRPSLSRTNLDGGLRVSRGVYRTDRHQSPFSIIRQAPAAFDDLFRLIRTREAALVLSYSPHLDGGRSRPRVMAIADIEHLARQHFSKIERIDIEGVTHSKLNRTDMHLLAPETAEILLVCEA